MDNKSNLLKLINKMKIIGITGAIGCGKTTITNILKKYGIEVFDADKEVAEIYKDEKFLALLKGTFPRIFKGDLIDKRLLRKIVFSNQKELIKLEDIIEPFIQKRFFDKIDEIKGKKGILFIEAVLLFEKGWNRYCSEVWGVTVDLETQKKRVMKRDNITEQEFSYIYNLQMNKDLKCRLADRIIDTGCSLQKLENKVKLMLDEING